MIALAELLLLLLIALAAGRTLLRLLRLEPDTPLERLAYSAPLGFGIIAYLVLALGLIGLLRPLPVLLTLAALTALGLPGFAALRADFRLREPATDDSQPKGESRDPRLIPITAGLIAAAASVIALVNCFVPPGPNEWDALSYHLAAPKIFLDQGRIVYLPTDHHSNFPFTMQMLFLLGLMFNGFVLANLIHFATACLTGLAILTIARNHLRADIGWIAVTVFVTCPMVVWQAGAAYVELGFALFVVTSVAALIEYRMTRESRWLLLTALLVGFALSVKTLALIPLGVTLVLLLAWRTPVRRLTKFLAVALAVGSPFYLKAWAVTGNPVYPFGYRVFGGRDWSPELAETYASEHRGFGQSGIRTGVVDDVRGNQVGYKAPTPSERIRNLALAPFDLVALPRIFHNFNNPGFHAQLGFLVVALPAMLLLAPSPSIIARLLALFCGLWFLVWSQSMQYARYLVPMTPLLGLFGGEASARLGRASRLLAFLLAAAVVLQSVVTLGTLGASVPQKLAIAAGAEARERYLTSSVNIYASQQWLNGNTGAREGVVLFEETRGFYLNRPYLWGNGPHSLYIPYERFASGQEMANWFAGKGYRFGILNLQFSPAIQTEADHQRMREAIVEGTEAGLIREWYSNAARLEEIRTRHNDRASPDYAPHRFRDAYWRLLLGDAVENGGAIIRRDASSRGAVVLEFKPSA